MVYSISANKNEVLVHVKGFSKISFTNNLWFTLFPPFFVINEMDAIVAAFYKHGLHVDPTINVHRNNIIRLVAAVGESFLYI